MMEDINEKRWTKNLIISRDDKGKIIKNEFGKRIFTEDLITEEYLDVVKEDVLQDISYEKSSIIQQMLYHAFKRVEELEERIKKLEERK